MIKKSKAKIIGVVVASLTIGSAGVAYAKTNPINSENKKTEEKEPLNEQKYKMKMRRRMSEEKVESTKEKLDSLVKNGTITQEKADKIQETFKKAVEDKKARRDKMKNMTMEQRREYIENFKKEHKGPIKELIDDGTLSEEEGKAVRNALHFNKE